MSLRIQGDVFPVNFLEEFFKGVVGNAIHFLDPQFFLMWKCETFTAETAGAACFCFVLVFLLVVLCYSLIGCGVERGGKRKFAIVRKQLIGCSGAHFVSVVIFS